MVSYQAATRLVEQVIDIQIEENWKSWTALLYPNCIFEEIRSLVTNPGGYSQVFKRLTDVLTAFHGNRIPPASLVNPGGTLHHVLRRCLGTLHMSLLLSGFSTLQYHTATLHELHIPPACKRPSVPIVTGYRPHKWMICGSSLSL